MDKKKFGERLRELRKSKTKLTMKEFGQIFSLAESTISGYENGARMPDMEILDKFAKYFDVSLDYLLGRSYSPSSIPERQSDDESIFFFDQENITEEEMEELKKHLDYLRYRASQENKKNQ
ncbi:Transcriptional regulator, contains XRE-family HTH domain [Evansella caseinilytica]|uniref:Transcriptional regulator, contains XRE-family HTH domain n=1 Tax=Evansella caseinilytica TaxID=1503961 RepID=A0A1H3V2I8_9BACI|nr:helix-turn-helix transcriptional regulator [Evansella caseinilytica]SDZ68776.1 Transcriptional regulator, contains XRE-family HTH domain [Evansella caseinilytica]